LATYPHIFYRAVGILEVIQYTMLTQWNMILELIFLQQFCDSE
jgi:hypothetical protein